MRLPFFGAPHNGGRATLVIPTHEWVDHQDHWHEVEPVLQKAAQQIVDSKLIWRWNRYDGTAKLVRWSLEPDQIFVGFSIDDWRSWLGQQWRIVDTAGTEWAGPSRAVADRIYAAVLNHPGLPVASFELQGEMQRKGARK